MGFGKRNIIAKGNIFPFRNDIAFFVLPREIAHLPQHILNEYSIPRGGVTDQHVGHGAYQLAVLDDGRAAHECGQERAKVYKKIFFSRIIFSSLGTENICTSLPIAAYLCSPIA